MERCPHCGNKLSSIDVLCPKCGTVVEVIQAKSNFPSPSETVMDGNVKDPETAQKKDIPKYFNVYYEGLPDEDSEDDESRTAPGGVSSEEPASPVQTDVDERPNGVRGAVKPDPEKDNEEKGIYNKIVTAKLREDDNNDYSPRYLENLKSLNLPEIDDISNFDPEEYMREYKYRKILGNQAALDDSQSPSKKQWLEIEETESNLASELTKVREDVQKQAEQPVIAQRRYRGTGESRTERKRDYTEKRRDNISEENREIFGEDNVPIPAKNKKRKPKVASMILFWVVISVAIVFSCIFLDNYIKYSYGTYDTFIYSITNGQVDLDPGKP